MTIPEALQHATKGGYHIKGSDGIDAVYTGANSDYSVWTSNDKASSFLVPVADTFLDPHFWRALGHGLGWEQAVRTVHAVEHGRATLVTRTGHHWVSYWHRFIDGLVEGKTAADFFARVPCHPNMATRMANDLRGGQADHAEGCAPKRDARA